jgi:hypothetical protein
VALLSIENLSFLSLKIMFQYQLEYDCEMFPNFIRKERPFTHFMAAAWTGYYHGITVFRAFFRRKETEFVITRQGPGDVSEIS